MNGVATRNGSLDIVVLGTFAISKSCQSLDHRLDGEGSHVGGRSELVCRPETSPIPPGSAVRSEPWSRNEMKIDYFSLNF